MLVPGESSAQSGAADRGGDRAPPRCAPERRSRARVYPTREGADVAAWLEQAKSLSSSLAFVIILRRFETGNLEGDLTGNSLKSTEHATSEVAGLGSLNQQRSSVPGAGRGPAPQNPRTDPALGGTAQAPAQPARVLAPPTRAAGLSRSGTPARGLSLHADTLSGQAAELGTHHCGLSKTGTARGAEPGLAGQVTAATATLCVVPSTGGSGCPAAPTALNAPVRRRQLARTQRCCRLWCGGTPRSSGRDPGCGEQGCALLRPMGPLSWKQPPKSPALHPVLAQYTSLRPAATLPVHATGPATGPNTCHPGLVTGSEVSRLLNRSTRCLALCLARLRQPGA